NDEEAVEDYVELLRMCPDTEFTSYDLETGTWEFHVSHFSSYAVDGSDYYISSSRRVATSSTPSTSMPSTSASPSPSLSLQLDHRRHRTHIHMFCDRKRRTRTRCSTPVHKEIRGSYHS